MKTKELRKWLETHGAVFKEGGKHTKVYCNGKQTTLPRHNEIPQGTAVAICSQLGIKKPPSK